MTNRFDIPKDCVPSGWHYRWIRLMGAEHIKELRAKGWRPMLAKETSGLTLRTGRAWVRHDSMTLMKRVSHVGRVSHGTHEEILARDHLELSMEMVDGIGPIQERFK